MNSTNTSDYGNVSKSVVERAGSRNSHCKNVTYRVLFLISKQYLRLDVPLRVFTSWKAHNRLQSSCACPYIHARYKAPCLLSNASKHSKTCLLPNSFRMDEFTFVFFRQNDITDNDNNICTSHWALRSNSVMCD